MRWWDGITQIIGAKLKFEPGHSISPCGAPNSGAKPILPIACRDSLTTPATKGVRLWEYLIVLKQPTNPCLVWQLVLNLLLKSLLSWLQQFSQAATYSGPDLPDTIVVQLYHPFYWFILEKKGNALWFRRGKSGSQVSSLSSCPCMSFPLYDTVERQQTGFWVDRSGFIF